MAKEYAKGFYASKAWKRTQRAYMQSVNRVCERCGSPARIVHHRTYLTPGNITDPNVSLAWSNLEALCYDCHNREHMETSGTQEGLHFDANGNLVRE